ncbi:MAG TPA: organomercurial lyase [Gaiellaceae bacterium]|nr:organomercurial lyase [Gaiellaceae bacterium]
MSGELDNRVRLHIYERFVADGRPPTVAETAAALAIGDEEAAEAYRRLERARVIVLAPGTLDVWMANPLSAVPTPFRATTERGSFWGNCVWDGLGVIAMLGGRGALATACSDCGDPMTLAVEERTLAPADGVVHFAVPARRWWENIAFT